MGKKHLKAHGLHIHYYYTATSFDDGHVHYIQNVTAPAPNTPYHWHKYKGLTSCNDEHFHHYKGKSGAAISVAGSHVHNYTGRTSRDDQHSHRYVGTTGPGQLVCP